MIQKYFRTVKEAFWENDREQISAIWNVMVGAKLAEFHYGPLEGEKGKS